MNIFYLDHDPLLAAKYHCDKHCLKMIQETALMLSTAHRILDGNEYADNNKLYRKAYSNHPCTKWVRDADSHYYWAYALFDNLIDEYYSRYKKIHATSKLLHPLGSFPKNINRDKKWSEPPQCMPKEYQRESTVDAYRLYYMKDKARFAKWSFSKKPEWFNPTLESNELIHDETNI